MKLSLTYSAYREMEQIPGQPLREIGEAKTRLWLIYLAGCALAFSRNTVGIFQTLASKRSRGPAELPPTRADLYI